MRHSLPYVTDEAHPGIAQPGVAGSRPSKVATMTSLRVERAGRVPYLEAWERQKQLHEQRVNDQIDDTVLLLEHPPVYTAGKRTEGWERPVNSSPVIDVDRGGRITWHGPGQLVGYPIVKLADPVDVVAYVRRMEAMLMRACERVGLATTQISGRSGVWVPADARGPDRKVGAIGIRVARGVTQHGFALNCNPDLSFFSQIVPCGLPDAGATSLTAELGREVTVEHMLPIVEDVLPELVAVPALHG